VALDLTSREVAVLEYLMRRRGQVVSKRELLVHCWDATRALVGVPAVYALSAASNTPVRLKAADGISSRYSSMSLLRRS
jgi:hypothetical protein